MDQTVEDTEKGDALKEGDRIVMDANRLFACPMHPEFITADPEARCPECEMKVIPFKELEEKVEFYTCPMHPEFLTTDPNGRCPECGMKLEKVEKIKK